jgi:transcriptional regulator with PAS, ATPase and Fis domain
MRSVIDLMSKVAQADDTTVLITGESGTGKELVARGIHCLSARKDKHFYSINISAIPGSLFESEFFGHKKGAFTGATEDKAGWFEIAQNSTLFMDEICDVDPNLQGKLLRVLEERKIIKVGSHKEIPVNVRVVAATNKKIKQLVRTSKFRTDLYYRLSSFEIHIPPLRERKEDIPLLLEHFAEFYAQKMNKSIKGIDEKVTVSLMDYDFPGNVRELKNMVERAVILCEGDTLQAQHFPIVQSKEHEPEGKEEEVFNLKIMEKTLIVRALEKTNYNKSKAGELLHISRQSLNRKIKKFGL